ncbi:hypothetical protein P354_41495 [Streptomyces noursei PD-1]|uniref:Uncharacterized protein n=2 Tax=Streptomyces noursei TaxID=1971 RepID=A0A401QRI8_STRNR|nr:hypothetical protein K530_08959 [Streptomyces noursei CCRC 11814]EXU86590.1 hypothetical protein P354_41495 [Streptomyces noursei PD-1]GCB88020.1 hypothetical protein SALB_00689 [Streptomyces noursei]
MISVMDDHMPDGRSRVMRAQTIRSGTSGPVVLVVGRLTARRRVDPLPARRGVDPLPVPSPRRPVDELCTLADAVGVMSR